MAISIEGSFVKGSNNKEALKMLLNVFDNVHETIRACTYTGLAFAMVKTWNEIPGEGVSMKLLGQEKLDLTIIKKAHEFLISS